MRIIVDINHPAHVHFFREFIREMSRRGHDVTITASDKDVALDLLRAYGISFHHLGTYGETLMRKAMRLPLLSYRMFQVARRERAEVIMGIGSFRAAHAARLLPSCKSLVFTDTEHAKEQIALYRPFADAIYTPTCFRGNLGRNHYRYQGYHELAYLHPSRFEPDRDIVERCGVNPNEPFFVVRFISWNASHDVGQRGFSHTGKIKLVEQLAKRGRVLISSETSLPRELEPCRLRVSPDLLHHFLALAHLYVGEGATMASEAAVLGTPAIYVNTLGAGTIDEQQAFGLLHQISRESDAIETAISLAGTPDARLQNVRSRVAMLASKVDVTQWMVDAVESKWNGEPTSEKVAA